MLFALPPADRWYNRDFVPLLNVHVVPAVHPVNADPPFPLYLPSLIFPTVIVLVVRGGAEGGTGIVVGCADLEEEGGEKGWGGEGKGR